MDKQLQNKAMFEIFNSCDVIIASKKKNIADKVGQELGGSLYSMGVKADEAEILFEIAREKIFNEDSDNGEEIYLMGYTDGEPEDE